MGEVKPQQEHGDESVVKDHSNELFTLVLRACVVDNVKVLTELIKLGASVNESTPNGLTPLCVASVNGSINTVRILLAAGVDMGTKNNLPALVLAAKSVRIDIMDALLTHAKSLIPTTYFGDALMYAIAERSELTILKLIKEGADVNTSFNGLTPLMICCQCGDFEIARLLIEIGANINHPTTMKLKPLVVASANGHVDIVEYLVNTHKVDQHSLPTAVVFAAQQNHVSCVDTIIQYGVSGGGEQAHHFAAQTMRNAIMNPTNYALEKVLLTGFGLETVGEDGMTALMVACEHNAAEFVDMLVRKGADPNKIAENGLNCLVIASAHGFTEIVSILLRAGVDPTDSTNSPALMLAGKHKHENVMLLLVRSVLDKDGRIRSDEAGNMPPNISSFLSFAFIVSITEDSGTVFQCLLDAGVDVNGWAVNSGTVPLLAAAERGALSVVEALIRHGADVNVGGRQLTPLAVAARNGHEAVVDLLLMSGADPELFDNAVLFASKAANVNILQNILHHGLQARPDWSRSLLPLCISNSCTIAVKELLTMFPKLAQMVPSPLMIASERGTTDIVEMLISCGADVNYCAPNGLTALVVASVNGHEQVVDALLSNGGALAKSDNVPAIVLSGKYGHIDILRKLVQVGSAEGINLDRALLSAIVDSCVVVVAEIVRNIHSNQCGLLSPKEVPLRLAVHNKHKLITTFLVATGANIQWDQFYAEYGYPPTVDKKTLGQPVCHPGKACQTTETTEPTVSCCGQTTQDKPTEADRESVSRDTAGTQKETESTHQRHHNDIATETKNVSVDSTMANNHKHSVKETETSEVAQTEHPEGDTHLDEIQTSNGENKPEVTTEPSAHEELSSQHDEAAGTAQEPNHENDTTDGPSLDSQHNTTSTQTDHENKKANTAPATGSTTTQDEHQANDNSSCTERGIETEDQSLNKIPVTTIFKHCVLSKLHHVYCSTAWKELSDTRAEDEGHCGCCLKIASSSGDQFHTPETLTPQLTFTTQPVCCSPFLIHQLKGVSERDPLVIMLNSFKKQHDLPALVDALLPVYIAGWREQSHWLYPVQFQRKVRTVFMLYEMGKLGVVWDLLPLIVQAMHVF